MNIGVGAAPIFFFTKFMASFPQRKTCFRFQVFGSEYSSGTGTCDVLGSCSELSGSISLYLGGYPKLWVYSYLCVLRREFSGMIHWLTLNNHPSNPQQAIQQPYVKRTSFAPMVQKSRNSTAPSCMVSDPSRN